MTECSVGELEGGWPFRFSWPSAFLTLIALSLASIWLHERAQRNAECALAAHTLETKLVSLLIDLGRAESSQRGYLLSGDPRFLPTRRPAIDAVLPEGGAELMLDADPVEIDPDRAVAAGVLVTELVINAKKHAYPASKGQIRVGLRAINAHSAELSVENGGTDSANGASSAPQGLGTIIIQAMGR